MGRRRKKGNPVHGWIVLDKPTGMTSTQGVAVVRRLFNAQKAGHAGTLDPLATGLLGIALGEATKTVPWLMEAGKTYRFTVRWGIATTTGDAEGEIVETSGHRPEKDALIEALPAFTGDILQIPPAYSAIKVNGQRAYDLARDGQEVVLQPRSVHIESLTLDACSDADTATLTMACGKGTYVRSLARDLARHLGTCGHVIDLRRIASGPFDESDAISLEKLEDLVNNAHAQDVLLPIETVLDDIPALALTGNMADLIENGQPISVGGYDPLTPIEAYAIADNRLIAMGVIEGGKFNPRRVLKMNPMSKEV